MVDFLMPVFTDEEMIPEKCPRPECRLLGSLGSKAHLVPFRVAQWGGADCPAIITRGKSKHV